jgi:hypothetical protein
MVAAVELLALLATTAILLIATLMITFGAIVRVFL